MDTSESPLRAMDVTRELCDRMRAQAGTDTMVKHNTTALRALLLWGQQHGYFTTVQAELLPRGCSMPAPRLESSTVLRRPDARARPRPQAATGGSPNRCSHLPGEGTRRPANPERGSCR